MEYLSEFLVVALIHLLAVMSPGPDFALVVKNSLVCSRKSGVYSAFGLCLGIFAHVTYCLLGIALIISQSILLFNIIKFLGAGYLIYIGYKSFKAGKGDFESESFEKKSKLTPFSALKMGFLTNLLNPKATLLFLSIFTQVIDVRTPIFIQVFYGIEMSLMTFVWFTFVAILFSNETVKAKFSSVHQYFERLFGVILIALGLKVALSSNK